MTLRGSKNLALRQRKKVYQPIFALFAGSTFKTICLMQKP